MAVTKTVIISNAITLLGHAPIISLVNGDKMVVAAEQAFDLLLPTILSENNWRFATTIQPLTLLLETPPAPWTASYQLPSGFLKLLRLYPNIYEFDLYNNNRLYTFLGVPSNDGQPFSIEYVFMPEISQLPARFVKYFIFEIANYLALSNAQRPDYAAYIRQQCQAEFAMAAANEAQNRPQYSQVLFPVLTNRCIGGFIGNGG
jgi:hypothetical protein